MVYFGSLLFFYDNMVLRSAFITCNRATWRHVADSWVCVCCPLGFSVHTVDAKSTLSPCCKELISQCFCDVNAYQVLARHLERSAIENGHG